MTTLDVLIIGAGQAGLALGYHLQKTGLSFQLVERHIHVGESWRQRYDSLVLFTPRRYSALPGLALTGAPDGYPGKDELADYLAAYARHFNLPVKTGTSIQALEQNSGGYRAMSQSGEVIEARAAVLATGAFQTPVVPPMASQLSADVLQLTVESYKNAVQVPPGVVLIVGDGAAGRDIAHDLQGRRSVILAVGRARRLLPERILGQSTWWWLDKLGLVRLSGETALGRRMHKADPFPGKGNTLKHLQAQDVRVLPRVVAAQDHSVTFANGATAEISTVIWAIGYRDNSAWVAVPEIKDTQGNFAQRQGLTALSDFYFIGRPWQRSRGSALITGVGDDARRIRDQIVLGLGGHQPPAGVELGPKPARSPEKEAALAAAR